jgi:EmrB/QacA subfamily drug resistance transporter
MDRSRTYRLRWWTLLTLSLSLLIIGLDNTILNVAIPTLQQEFSASAATLQWMIDAYIIVFAGLLLVMGALGDRFGRARALQAGLLIFGLGSLAAAYAGSSNQLIGWRSVMGIGGALIMPSTLSVIIDVFPREERGRAIAIWSGVAGLGVGLGPLIGGLLLDHFWWGSVFLVNVPIVVIALALGWFLVPESRDPIPEPIDFPGALFSLGAVTAIVYAVIEAPHRGWSDPLVIGTFLLAIILAALFVLRERRTDHPMIDLDIFRNPRFAVGSASIGIAFFALFGIILALTQYLQFVRGYSPLEAGVRLVPLAFGIMIGAGNSNRLVTRFGTTRVVAAGFVILAAALASGKLWSVDTPYWLIGTGLFLLALGMGTVMAPATDSVMGAVPEHKAGVGSAMNDVTRQVAGAFGVAVIGSILNTVYTNRMGEAVAQLPPPAAGPAADNVGAAIEIARRIGGAAGERLADASRAAFVDALGVTVLVAMAVALAGMMIALRYLPAEDVSTATSARKRKEQIVEGETGDNSGEDIVGTAAERGRRPRNSAVGISTADGARVRSDIG